MNSRNAVCPTPPDLSALLDGELDPQSAPAIEEHVAGCTECAQKLEALGRVRRAVRAQPAGDVPDLVGSIVDRIEAGSVLGSGRSEWNVRARIASIAAVAAAVLLFGASLPGSDDPPQVALAAQIVDKVRTEARGLDSYRATFSIVERGWDERVGTRHLSAEILFDAPENYRLTITDDTVYPNESWPTNDVELIAGAHRWWIKEPSSCPPESLPQCNGVGTTVQERVHVQRQPFEGTIGLPTDLVLPLKTLADTPLFRVEGRSDVAGRPAVEISLAYRQAVPLVDSLQSGGLWRDFYPSDPVKLWIDEATGFPLKFSVRADNSDERRIWAERLGYFDGPDQILLEVTASDFSEPRGFPPHTFSGPTRGIESSGWFDATKFSTVADQLAPSDVAGLRPFRAGTTRSGQEILSYAKGMAWLKIIETPTKNSPPATDLRAEEIRLPDATWAYYLPATARQGRSIEMFGAQSHLVLETNLPRSAAVRMASALDFEASRLDGRTADRSSFELQRVDPEAIDRLGFVRSPTFLPTGYTARAAYTSRRANNMSATVFYRGAESEYDGLGIRITQARGVDLLPPSPEEGVQLKTNESNLRWFPERGEVDWISDGVYTSISAPSFPRSTLLSISESLR